MKKILKYIVLSIVSVGMLAGFTACGAKSDPVKDDLYNYLNEMETIQTVQQQAINDYNSYVNDKESDSQELLTALESNIIPNYENYISQLNALAPVTEEVQNVKAVCVNGANKQLEALNKVVEAIKACDTNMLTEADILIGESESIFADYEKQLSDLAAQHEIALVSSRTGAGASESSDDASEDAGSDSEEAAE